MTEEPEEFRQLDRGLARALYAIWCNNVDWSTLLWDELPVTEQDAWVRVASAQRRWSGK